MHAKNYGDTIKAETAAQDHTLNRRLLSGTTLAAAAIGSGAAIQVAPRPSIRWPSFSPLLNKRCDAETQRLPFCIESEITREERYREGMRVREAMIYQQSIDLIQGQR